VRAKYNIFMTANYKIFKTIIDLVTIIHCILLLALFMGIINILLSIKSVLLVLLGKLGLNSIKYPNDF